MPVVPETLWVRIVMLVVIALRDSGCSRSTCCVVDTVVVDTACSRLVLFARRGNAVAWFLQLDAEPGSCPRCRWQFFWILRGWCHEEHLHRDAEPASCPRCRWQFYGILRGLCHMKYNFLVTFVDAQEFFLSLRHVFCQHHSAPESAGPVPHQAPRR